MASAARYMRRGLAESTAKVYDSAWLYFMSFCAAYGVSVLPVNVSVVCAFMVHCFESRGLQPASIRNSLSGIQFHLRCLDPSACNILSIPSVKLLLNGLKKECPSTKDSRLPFLLPMVHKMVSCLRKGCFGSYEDALLEAVFFTAFYGFLRCGEFTTSTSVFNPLHDLTVGDLSVRTNMYAVHLKHSKTDQDGRGADVVISSTNTGFCPLVSLQRYMAARPRAGRMDPLFLTEKGKAVSRSWFTSRLRVVCGRCGFSGRYTAHSFRIGAATQASGLVPPSTLKAMGRWSSSAFERYVRPGEREVLAAQRSMGAPP